MVLPAAAAAGRRLGGKGEPLMKILGWIIGIIFLIGLLVVIGAGKLIF